jgi:hypothetical protein
MSIDAASIDIEQARSTWKDLRDLLVNGSYDTNASRPSLAGQSIASFSRRSDLIFEGLLALNPSDGEYVQAAVLVSRAAEISRSAKSFSEQASIVSSTLSTHWRDGVALKDMNGNFALQVVQQDGGLVANVDMSGNFQNMDVALGQLETHLALLLPLCRANAVGDLSARAAALGDLTRDMESLREQVKRIADAASASGSVVDGKEKEAQALVTQAEALVAKITAQQAQATTDTSSVTTLVEKIKTIGASADTLEKMVAGHASSVEAFQSQLNARIAELEKFQADTKTAREENAKRDAEIERLMKQSDAMISGATTAGLAKSMEDTRARYEERMTSARRGFYFAVAFLVVSAVPLVFHLLPGLFGAWASSGPQDRDSSPYAFIGRIFLLLPATWLTAFFAKSYASFFDLEREYAHKAALAMSVDGFKRQAPKYEDEITAEVFLEIRNNPGNGDTTLPASHPLYDVLAKVVGKFLDGKAEDPKKS